MLDPINVNGAPKLTRFEEYCAILLAIAMVLVGIPLLLIIGDKDESPNH